MFGGIRVGVDIRVHTAMADDDSSSWLDDLQQGKPAQLCLSQKLWQQDIAFHTEIGRIFISNPNYPANIPVFNKCPDYKFLESYLETSMCDDLADPQKFLFVVDSSSERAVNPGKRSAITANFTGKLTSTCTSRKLPVHRVSIPDISCPSSSHELDMTYRGCTWRKKSTKITFRLYRFERQFETSESTTMNANSKSPWVGLLVPGEPRATVATVEPARKRRKFTSQVRCCKKRIWFLHGWVGWKGKRRGGGGSSNIAIAAPTACACRADRAVLHGTGALRCRPKKRR